MGTTIYQKHRKKILNAFFLLALLLMFFQNCGNVVLTQKQDNSSTSVPCSPQIYSVLPSWDPTRNSVQFFLNEVSSNLSHEFNGSIVWKIDELEKTESRPIVYLGSTPNCSKKIIAIASFTNSCSERTQKGTDYLDPRCTTIPVCAGEQPPNKTSPTACPENQIGSITELTRYICTDGNWKPLLEITNSCVPVSPLPPVESTPPQACSDSTVDYEYNLAALYRANEIAGSYFYALDHGVGKTLAIKLSPDPVFKTFGERINGMNVSGSEHRYGLPFETAAVGKQEIVISPCKGDFTSAQALKVTSNSGLTPEEKGQDSVFYFYADRVGYSNGRKQFHLTDLETVGSKPWYVNVRILERSTSGRIYINARFADNVLLDERISATGYGDGSLPGFKMGLKRSEVNDLAASSDAYARKNNSWPDLLGTAFIDYILAINSTLAIELPEGDGSAFSNIVSYQPGSRSNSCTPGKNCNSSWAATVSFYKADYTVGAEHFFIGSAGFGGMNLTRNLDTAVRENRAFLKIGPRDRFYINIKPTTQSWSSGGQTYENDFGYLSFSMSAGGTYSYVQCARSLNYVEWTPTPGICDPFTVP